MDSDIIVIGASPAGMAAARNAANSGSKVLLLEKKALIGSTTHPANTFFKGMFSRTGETVDQSYVIKNLKGAHIVSLSGKDVIIESPAYFLDRKKFDEYYAIKTEKSGVKILTDTTVTDIIKNDNITTVITNKKNLTCKLLIVSDGINSKIAQTLNMHPIKYPKDIAWSMEAEIESPGIGEPDMFEYYVGSHSPGWKSTYSPCGGDRATLGVYVRRHGTDVSSFFNSWINNFKEIKNISNLKIINTVTGGDPIVAIPDEIIGNGVMIVGGSAAQSGIGYAMHAGQICGNIAAKAIEKNDVSKKYLKKYVDLWNKEYKAEYYLGRIALEALRKMSDKEIDNLMNIFVNEDISFITGDPFTKAVKVGSFIIKKKPSAFLTFRALLR